MTTITQHPLALADEAQSLLFRDARTANTFTDEPVSDARIEAIYDLVKWAPTALNSQPLRVVLIRSEQARQRLLPLLAAGNRLKTEQAPLTAILAADVTFHEHLPRLFPHLPTAKDWFADESRRVESARFNAALQIGYFVLGVRASGLAAGPMTGFDAAAVDREFFPDGDRRALVVVNIGNPGPDASFPRSPRLDFDEVVTAI